MLPGDHSVGIQLSQIHGIGRPPRHCSDCPIRRLALFHPFADDALERLNRLREGSRVVPAGAPITSPGMADGYLYTLFRGWAFSYRLHADGRRQILDFHLAGDLLGTLTLGAPSTDVGHEALTPVLLCAFRRDMMEAAAREHPNLGHALSWMAAREEATLAEHLVSIGRRSAEERVAHLLMELWTRARWRGGDESDACDFPPTQRHLADALGLTPERVNRAMAALRAGGLIETGGRRLRVMNPRRLAEIGEWTDTYLAPRPLL
ncbi:Crp/Fnr family transcriptional regulator [Roseomonas alkaliterrae]|uniref:CRP-like cAMP-binding protein n=1 Tax=Neoroseomonas alkaliterrae TaxID=1452450 RepID=A0A840Y3X1_9PROT|nr:Crp/Fnr family transcriptional regulator [Neoroseomonas alkaliterrae]MBB5689322.1 CRP-like cAMP-binding protein [Neoroseomonas alkaliterrae]MBR0677781.1 Crp/Fnr family transcriptional regulator [Neoroseomonas alkaliterrae]